MVYKPTYNSGAPPCIYGDFGDCSDWLRFVVGFTTLAMDSYAPFDGILW
jgi:hypothetical protein